jgi:hypothetical protein
MTDLHRVQKTSSTSECWRYGAEITRRRTINSNLKCGSRHLWSSKL